MALAAAVPALADPVPPPPPPPSGPQPAPYPGGPEEPPPPACEHTICLPHPGATQDGVAAKKHIGQVKYGDFANSGEISTAEMTTSPDAPAQQLTIVGLSWGKLDGTGPVYSADPMEGGQITRPHYRPGRQKSGTIKQTMQADGTGPVYSADPMEGGQVTSDGSVAARTYQPGKPTYGDLVDNAPVMVSEPVAKGTAKFKTLAGACTNGVHLTKVFITARSGSYTLHDATVISVEPAEAVDGQAMEEVTVAYDSLGD